MLHLHRLIFYPITLTAFCWGFIALRINPFSLIFNYQFVELLKAFYIVGFTASFWPMAYIELVDYVHSRLGKNGKHYLEYSKSLQKDLLIAVITATLLASIYWIDSANYGFSGIDIAFVGFPFLINALYTLIQSTRVTIAGKPIRKRAPLLMFSVVLVISTASYWLLVKNSSGELDTDQALFLQITILLSGLSFFLSSNFMLHGWKHGRFEASAFKLYFFTEVVRSKFNFYSDLDKALKPYNQLLEKRKSQHATAVRKQQARKRKR